MTSPGSRISTRRPSVSELVRAAPELGRFRPTLAVVDLGALAANYAAIAARVGAEVSLLPAVKADAYGHGAGFVARRLRQAGARRFAVALVEEGIELRRSGIDDEILLLGYVPAAQLALAVRHGLTLSVHDRESFDRIDSAGRAAGRRIAVHVKVDTGMSRIGFPPEDYAGAVRLLADSRGVAVEGVFTNFASADTPDDPSTSIQIGRLDDFVTKLARGGVDPGLVHASNSAGILSHPAGWKRAVRPGITLYGLHPGELVAREKITPVLSLETEVAQVKNVDSGCAVGYGGSWIAERPSRIATIPIGYDDGLPRGLSNRGRVLLNNGPAVISGRVSMDMTMADVTGIAGVDAGSPVTVIGERGGERILTSDIAAMEGTISYEILCGIGARVPRVFVEEGRIVGLQSPFVASRERRFE